MFNSESFFVILNSRMFITNSMFVLIRNHIIVFNLSVKNKVLKHIVSCIFFRVYMTIYNFVYKHYTTYTY